MVTTTDLFDVFQEVGLVFLFFFTERYASFINYDQPAADKHTGVKLLGI